MLATSCDRVGRLEVFNKTIFKEFSYLIKMNDHLKGDVIVRYGNKVTNIFYQLTDFGFRQ